jgi:hypothetical protein
MLHPPWSMVPCAWYVVRGSRYWTINSIAGMAMGNCHTSLRRSTYSVQVSLTSYVRYLQSISNLAGSQSVHVTLTDHISHRNAYTHNLTRLLVLLLTCACLYTTRPRPLACVLYSMHSDVRNLFSLTSQILWQYTPRESTDPKVKARGRSHSHTLERPCAHSLQTSNPLAQPLSPSCLVCPVGH